MVIASEEIIRIIASAVIGLVIGFTRKNKPAGMRTFALICIGATVFTIISLVDYGGNADPSRVISQIVTGIGFLGVGIIWKGDNRVGGLTTAAAVWVTASIGILIGLGMWPETIVASILSILILLSKNTEKKLEKYRNWGIQKL